VSQPEPTFALVDCNNFYASCEKLFRPDLKHRPLVVLSNNDGCVVARSKEAKALGIKMGVPIFKIRHELRQHNIAVFSSNYTLYADMSARVMRTLEELAQRVEVYSIDEAFLDLTGTQSLLDNSQFGQQVRQIIGDWTGIAVCVGIAPTKTLAKLANHAAKKYPATQGVVDLSDRRRQQRLLALLPADEIWGIGRRLGLRLQQMGINSALDLANANPKNIRQHFSVVVERTVRELNGESCIDFEELPPTKKQIVCSRSFGERVTSLQEMREAICKHSARAAEKLRKEKRYAKIITVFIRTSPFNAQQPQYANSLSGELSVPSDDSRDLINQAIRLLEHIWRDGYAYAKAGVMLSDFYEPGVYQPDIFDQQPNGKGRRGHRESQTLMSTLDKINRQGKSKLFFAGQGVKNNSGTKSWVMKREHLSPAYTTNWNDILKVK
jgi:DNA polymerase V